MSKSSSDPGWLEKKNRDGQGSKRVILREWWFLYSDVPSGKPGRITVEWARQSQRDCSLGSLSPQANPYPMLSAFFSLLSSILPLLKRTQSLIILGVFASLLTFLHDVLVPQESMEVGVVCACVCLYSHAHTHGGYQTQIKLFYCILSDRSSVYSSALSHLNKTSICNNPINRKPY